MFSYIFPVLMIAGLTGGAYFAGTKRNTVASPGDAGAAPASRSQTTLKFEAGAPQLAALKIASIEEALLPVAEPLNGRIAYNEDLTVRVSSPIAGRILSLKAVPGDGVKVGQVLATIDAPDLAAAVADLRKAEADESRKKLSLERSQKLFDAEVVSRKDLESAVADQAAARAETQRAQLRLRNLTPAGGSDGRGLELRSPVNGVVADNCFDVYSHLRRSRVLRAVPKL